MMNRIGTIAVMAFFADKLLSPMTNVTGFLLSTKHQHDTNIRRMFLSVPKGTQQHTKKIDIWREEKKINRSYPNHAGFGAMQMFSINFNFNMSDDDNNDTGDGDDDNNKYSKNKRNDDDNSNLLLFDDDDDDEIDAADGEDFTLFMESLKQWPLIPTDENDNEIEEAKSPSASASSSQSSSSSTSSSSASSATSASSGDLPQSGRYRGVSPLGNFFRFEAILDMASSSTSTTTTTTTTTNDDDGEGSGIASNNNNETYFSNIFSAADQLVKAVSAKEATTVADLLEQEESSAMEQDTIQFLKDSTAKSGSDGTTQQQPSSSPDLGKAAEAIVKDASARIEFLVNEASSVTKLSMNGVQDLVIRASTVFSPKNGTAPNNSTVEDVTNDIVNVAKKAAKDLDLDVEFAADQARETTSYVQSMVSVANNLFGAGYAYGSKSGLTESVDSPLVDVLNIPKDSRPLFANSPSARLIDPLYQYQSVVKKGAEMGTLAGAVYESGLSKSHKLGHSFVANGTVADVAWMVTDSIDYESSFEENRNENDDSDLAVQYNNNNNNKRPMLVRTITIRGFDASDETVDRESLLNVICAASGEPMSPDVPNVIFHSGLLSTARAIYKEMDQYISWTSPRHKLVFNGHSIGGSLSILLLLLFVCDKGADYVNERVLRVFTHGSPPISSVISGLADNKKATGGKKGTSDDMYDCPVLSAFGLPSEIVYGYVQPYDPIVRFLTESDPLYPLVDDIGKDEMTLYSSGPPRSLRPLTRALFSAWDGWPEFRENWKSTNQNYRSVGIQHILLPEPLRYLNDRFVSTNIGVPPTEAIVRVSSGELLEGLEDVFPLDVFQISLIPQAVRSFLHHFFPAYDISIGSYATKLEKEVLKPTSGKEKASRRPAIRMSGIATAAIETNSTFSI